MKKKTIIISIVLVIIIAITSVLCFNNYNKDNQKEFKITFEDSRCDSRERVVYTYPYSN